MSDLRIVEQYPRSRSVVWKALTDPALVPLWTSTGQGGRPEGFQPEVGAQFTELGDISRPVGQRRHSLSCSSRRCTNVPQAGAAPGAMPPESISGAQLGAAATSHSDVFERPA